MTHPDPANERPSEADRRRSLRDWLVAVLVTESIALGIALVTPITPSKTGSTWTPADFFSPNPTYVEKVAASFVLLNAIVLGLGMAAWLISRRGGPR